jgi:hypothetical protein
MNSEELAQALRLMAAQAQSMQACITQLGVAIAVLGHGLAKPVPDGDGWIPVQRY